MTFEVHSSPGNESRVEESQTTTVSTAEVRYCPALPEDPTRIQLMRVMERSEALSFWRDEAEDIYDTNDGEPV